MKEFHKGDIKAAPLSTLRSPEYVQQLASFYSELGLSGDMTVDWILDQLYLHHEGKLYDYRGKEIDLKKLELADLFGEDTRRTINAFKKFAVKKPRQSLHRNLVPRIMMLDFARQIFINRGNEGR